uniref:Uncharacterized protein n=1 Tax=Strigamia maritima TaxID=126957 RepID=T1IQL1_STRMM
MVKHHKKHEHRDPSMSGTTRNTSFTASECPYRRSRGQQNHLHGSQAQDHHHESRASGQTTSTHAQGSKNLPHHLMLQTPAEVATYPVHEQPRTNELMPPPSMSMTQSRQSYQSFHDAALANMCQYDQQMTTQYSPAYYAAIPSSSFQYLQLPPLEQPIYPPMFQLSISKGQGGGDRPHQRTQNAVKWEAKPDWDLRVVEEKSDSTSRSSKRWQFAKVASPRSKSFLQSSVARN